MSIIVREIAGLSITKITDEVNVFPVEISGVDFALVRFQSTALTQVGARYLIGIKVDRGHSVEVLPLLEMVFSQDEIDNRIEKIIPFVVNKIDQVESFIVEAFLDASIASVRTILAPGRADVMWLEIDTGSGGLAGFIIDITINDPDIAKIVDVEFSPEFPLNQFVPDPVDGPTVKVSGVDLGEVVEGNQIGVVLASISLEGLAVGNTGFDVIVTQLDDDKGFPIRHTLTVDSFEVSA